jgi:hypothetical protein
MSERMSSAELTEQFLEPLPARTVLSLAVQSPSALAPWHADIGGTAGTHGDPGTRGGHGPNIPRVTMWAFFGQSDPGPGSRSSFGDAVSHSG